MISRKIQHGQALTSHFESFWSIVQCENTRNSLSPEIFCQINSLVSEKNVDYTRILPKMCENECGKLMIFVSLRFLREMKSVSHIFQFCRSSFVPIFVNFCNFSGVQVFQKSKFSTPKITMWQFFQHSISTFQIYSRMRFGGFPHG